MLNTQQSTTRLKMLAADFTRSGARVAHASLELIHAVVTSRFPTTSLADQVELDKIREIFGFKNVMQVSRLLDEAVRRNLIRINVAMPSESLVQKLRDRFPCLTKQVHLVDPDPDHRAVAKSLGHQTAKVFDSIYSERGQIRVGIGGGTTMSQFVRQMDSKSRAVTVTPTALLTRSEIGVVFDSPYLAMMAHWKCGELSKSYICSVPPLPEQEVDMGPHKGQKRVASYCKRFMDENKSVRVVFEKSANAEVVFLGVAPLHEQSQIVSRAYSHFGIEHKHLEDLGGVADINYSVLDKDGNDLSPEIGRQLGLKEIHKDSHPFLLALSMGRIKQLAHTEGARKDVILVAGSDHKTAPIRAVLKGGFVNGIITDSETARRLCETGHTTNLDHKDI